MKRTRAGIMPSSGTGPSAGAAGAGTVADVTQRLMAEFEDQWDLATISEVVSGARQDLESMPKAALPELVERLARQRLLDRPAATDRSSSSA